MIRANLLDAGGLREGGEELLASWRDAAQGTLWLDIEGELGDAELALLEDLGCHELALSDVRRFRHPPKVEQFEDHTFILFRGIASFDENLELAPQQVAFFVSARLLITVHRGESVSISEFWHSTDKARYLATPGLLALRIMHYSAGRYLQVLLGFEDKLSDLEDCLVGASQEVAMKALVGYRSRLLKLRRVFSYHEKLARTLLEEELLDADEEDEEGELHHASRDLHDRCERLFSLCGMYYDICSDLIEGHISISSHQLNITMRILTVITAVFVPLSFLAGLYGMNFENMPELKLEYAYFVLLGVMLFIAAALISLFRYKKWL
jgi:magnesium transporter